MIEKPINPCATCTNHTLKDLIFIKNNAQPDDWFSQPLSEVPTSKAPIRLAIQSEPCARRTDSGLGGTAEPKLNWSTLPPSIWQTSNLKDTLTMAGRAYSCFETRSPPFWTSPGPDMCFVLPEKIHNLSEAVACGVSTSHLVTGIPFFGTMSYSERHGNESYIISDAPERRKKKKRELLFPEACIASKEIVAAYTWTEQWNTWMAVIVAFSTRCYKWKRVNQYNFIRK